VAVGIYLPLSLSVPIFAGGLLSYLLARRARPFGQAAVDKSNHRAVLISSGLIAGEAIAGILIAFPRTLPQFADQQFPIPMFDSGLLTLAALFTVVAVIYWACKPAADSR
jgi:uncharacterized oligopeptide transporter (OPT) family protein